MGNAASESLLQSEPLRHYLFKVTHHSVIEHEANQERDRVIRSCSLAE